MSPFNQFGPNAGYVEELFRLYQMDPGLVDESWAGYFRSLNGALSTNGAVFSASSSGNAVLFSSSSGDEERIAMLSLAGEVGDQEAQARVTEIIAAFREYGHFKALINPLIKSIQAPAVPQEFNTSFSQEEKKQEFICSGFQGKKRMQLAELLAQLESTYCNSIGFEFEHIVATEEREWCRQQAETIYSKRNWFTPPQKKRFARMLVESEVFDAELHRKYVGSKRFSLQGGKTLIPLMDSLFSSSCTYNVKESVIGMAHRGRLNVLVSLLNKPFRDMFAEFEDKSVFSVIGAGDVKYHLGYTSLYKTGEGNEIRLHLAPNPSHLEFVNPIVEGISRSKQDKDYTASPEEVLPVLIHGDAAFAGQGVVFETFNFSQMPGYLTKGTVHIVINNQVGFTTDAAEARSSTYCTDMAKGISIPVLHVNAEDVDAACWAAHFAIDYRMRFKKDVIIDLICFRKFGHNEGDDPSFTQPIMYAEIKEKKSAAEIYTAQLLEEGVLTADDIAKFKTDFLDPFNAARLSEGTLAHGEACGIQGKLRDKSLLTGVEKSVLDKIAKSLITYPEGFVPHPKLKTILEKRVQTLKEGDGIEWGFAEALSYGSLVLEGIKVRLSGQDCGRGTFSHRHLELHDHEKPHRYYPLQSLAQSEGKGDRLFEVFNSTLSEAGIMGFEFGYASENQNSLVLWEGQFGDFANGGQVIIDQFLSSSESKWGQRSGLVLLLPHGYEGQGPEHSSARLERYLQLCAEGNMSVCYPSNAGQYFHLLRRQAHSEIKRPLIVMTPKSLLRLPEACSKLSDLTSGGFQPAIAEELGKGNPIATVCLSGKVYYEVKAALNAHNVKIIRLEELYPFPVRELEELIVKGKPLYWVQEEPRNMGAWKYIEDQFRTCLGKEITYVGRPESASTAAGSSRWHAFEQKTIIDTLLGHLKKG